MKEGDTVYFKDGRGWTQYAVRSLHEFEGSVTIANGLTKVICRKSETLDKSAYIEMRLQEERSEQEPRLRAVIDAYNAGHKTSLKIAEHLKIHHLAARGKLLAAHRLKFLVLPIGADGFPDPNPKDEQPSTDQPNK